MDARQTIIGERRTYSSEGCYHDHPFAQLILPLTGTLFIETQAHQFELNESAVFFLPPGCQHYFYARNTNEFLTFDIPSYWVNEAANCRVSQSIRLRLDDRWAAIRTLLLSEISDEMGNKMSDRTQTDTLHPLIHYIIRLLIQPQPSRSLTYLHEHYHRSLSVTQLAKIEGYCLAYYSEWFKSKTGTTPRHYIQNLRLQQAKHLLVHTDLPIYKIAQQIGFEQASSLTRLFQQREGTTPQRYRINSINPIDPKSKIQRTHR